LAALARRRHPERAARRRQGADDPDLVKASVRQQVTRPDARLGRRTQQFLDHSGAVVALVDVDEGHGEALACADD
jgi:hypothetical protein